MPLVRHLKEGTTILYYIVLVIVLAKKIVIHAFDDNSLVSMYCAFEDILYKSFKKSKSTNILQQKCIFHRNFELMFTAIRTLSYGIL